MNNEFWKQKEKELLERFTEPTYVEYKIVSTTEEGVADLKISNDHNIFDYLAVGIVCIFKELTGCTEKTVYVRHIQYPTSETLFASDNLFAKIPNALSDIMELGVVKYILSKCFKKNEMFDTNISMLNYFLYKDIREISLGLLEIEEINLDFDNFEDTEMAQKKVFNILKTLLISHWIGALQEFYVD